MKKAFYQQFTCGVCHEKRKVMRMSASKGKNNIKTYCCNCGTKRNGISVTL